LACGFVVEANTTGPNTGTFSYFRCTDEIDVNSLRKELGLKEYIPEENYIIGLPAGQQPPKAEADAESDEDQQAVAQLQGDLGMNAEEANNTILQDDTTRQQVQDLKDSSDGEMEIEDYDDADARRLARRDAQDEARAGANAEANGSDFGSAISEEIQIPTSQPADVEPLFSPRTSKLREMVAQASTPPVLTPQHVDPENLSGTTNPQPPAQNPAQPAGTSNPVINPQPPAKTPAQPAGTLNPAINSQPPAKTQAQKQAQQAVPPIIAPVAPVVQAVQSLVNAVPKPPLDANEALLKDGQGTKLQAQLGYNPSINWFGETTQWDHIISQLDSFSWTQTGGFSTTIQPWSMRQLEAIDPFL